MMVIKEISAKETYAIKLDILRNGSAYQFNFLKIWY